MKREYGISSTEALTEYSEDQLQSLLAQLPVDRVVNILPGMSKVEADNKYLEAFCDRDTAKVLSAQDNMKLFEQRADIKVKLRQATTDEDKALLQKQFDELTKQIQQI